MVETLKQNFIMEEIWILTFSGAFQRAEIYNKSYFKSIGIYEEEKIKSDFKESIKCYLTENIFSQYTTKVSSLIHIQNINDFTNWSKKFFHILNGGYLKIGISQKLINLHLKYLWSLGIIETPPHCPFDRIIISKLDYSNIPSWTKLDSIEIYKEFVSRAKNKAIKENLSIAEWELSIFQRR